jgi:pimeloyl-ACP methyl ester carboxylesterase
VRAGVERDFDRARNIASSNNHNMLSGGEPWRDRLGDLRAQTLVLHGDEDPLFPIEHGQALANEIPNAKLITLEGVGHELPRDSWDVAVPAILAQSAV